MTINNFFLKNRFYLSLLILISVFATKGIAQPACLGQQGKLTWNMWDGTSISSLTHQPNFPFKPARTENLTELATPSTGYNENYLSYVRGYLKVPQNGNYTFNVTGDDQVYFHLSANQTEKALTRIAYTDRWTVQDDHFKYTSQTSAPQSLVANQYYYFELLHREGGGGDHFSVHWKTPFATDTAFQKITTQYIYDYTCNLDCPVEGTPCDDNNPATLNDVQDGYCNCFGTPQTSSTPDCIGEKGFVNVLYYDDITGDRLTHLYFNPKYPLEPSRGGKIDNLTLYDSDIDNYGSVIKGFLTVPVSGTYYFNITGIRRAGLKISATENPEEAVFVAYYDANSGISTYDHDREATQTSQGQYLEKGKYYYLEVNHKANTRTDYLNIYWKTPFYVDDKWRRLDGAYLYQYDPSCDFFCYPAGTPCDDGSAATKDDVFDANCNCVGTPCPNNDCDESNSSAAAPPSTTCGPSDDLKNEAATAWVSCANATNPATNAPGKWISYDLGAVYYIDQANVWNYNVPASTAQGFKNVSVFVSNNGTNWTSVGIFNWSQATGLVGYEGFKQALGVTGRYILIQANSNFNGGNCFGLSKINFAVYDCLNIGKPCNDGNALTSNDVFNEDCKCVGTRPTADNFCSRVSRVHLNIPIDSDNYDAEKTIESSATILANNQVSYVAGESVSLLSGFEAQVGADFLAAIDGCSPNPGANSLVSNTVVRGYDVGNLFTIPPKDEGDTTSILAGNRLILGTPQNLAANLQISPNPTNDWAFFDFQIPTTSKVTLKVFAANGQAIATLIDNEILASGSYQQQFQAKELAKGMYLVNLITEDLVITKRLAVIE